MLSEQFVTETLSRAGWWKKQNIYIIGEVVKPVWKTILECLSFWVNTFSKKSYAIVNKTEDGVAVIPFHFKAISSAPIPDMERSYFIPSNQISSISFKKAFLAKKLILATTDGKALKFIVFDSNGKVPHHEENLKQWMALYA